MEQQGQHVGGSQSRRSRSQEVGQQRSREDTTSGRSKLEIAKAIGSC